MFLSNSFYWCRPPSGTSRFEQESYVFVAIFSIQDRFCREAVEERAFIFVPTGGVHDSNESAIKQHL